MQIYSKRCDQGRSASKKSSVSDQRGQSQPKAPAVSNP